MSLEMAEYIEVNLIGITLLLTMLVIDYKNHGSDRNEGHDHFIRMLVYNACILAVDMGIYLLRGTSSLGFSILDHILCSSFFFLHSWFSYEWIRYVIIQLFPRIQLSTRQHILLLLPALVSTFFVAMTPVTGWIYTLSDNDTYHRGPFILITFISSLTYLIASSVLILKEYKNPKASRKPEEYLWLLFLPIPMLIGNLLQLRLYGLSIVWIASAISLLIMFTKMQDNQLSRDGPTGVYNRRQTDAQLRWEMSRLKESDDLLLVAMLDVDHFKSINDTYGHLRGDDALITVASTVVANCRRTDFIGRFGGDEFLLIGHVKSQENANTIFQRLKQALDAKNGSGEYPYSLSLSIGYVLCGPKDEVNADKILDEADKKMYEVKQRRGNGQNPDTDYTGVISKLH